MPKFVLCKFRPEDSRSYTYLLEGYACEIGDEVKVPDNKSDGWKRVTVVGFSDEEPEFTCKAILGLAPPREDGAEINGIEISRHAPDCNLEAAATATRGPSRTIDDLNSPLAF